MIPSVRLIVFLVAAKISTRMLMITKTIISIIFCIENVIGEIAAATPRTNKIKKMLCPDQADALEKY